MKFSFMRPGMFLMLLVLQTSLASAAVSAKPGSVGELLADLERNMAGIENIQADFIQTKHLRLFRGAIELRGKIYMEKTGRFAWHTESPVRYSMIFRDGRFYQWHEETAQVEVSRVAEMPVLQMVMEQMRIWFYGAYPALLRDYVVEVIAEEPLELEFVPREETPAAAMIRRIRIRFSPDRRQITRIEMVEVSGDRSELQFEATRLNDPIAPAAWEARRDAV